MSNIHPHTITRTTWRLVALCTVVSGALFSFAHITHAAVTPDDPGNFITIWNTENEGFSNDDQILIPHADGSTYNYEIYWENTASSTQTGTTTVSGSGAASSPTLTFPEPGIYEVQASGTFPRIFFNNGGDKDKILTVEQWGDILWASMERAFFGASNLRVPATDAPDLSGVTRMVYMFGNATSFNDPINHWDVSNVTALSNTFQGASSFNQPLNNWETSSLTDLWRTYQGASSFNQPLNNWDVSNVTRMVQTFKNAASFNQPLDKWDTSSTTSMVQMFAGCCGFSEPPFDQDISTWNFESIATGSGWPNQGLGTMFRDGNLSQSNLDALLVSMASQNLNNNVPFHLGLKTYTDVGAQALNTLRDTYNWTITEQYQARYHVDPGAVLSGSNHQFPLNSGATTTPVEVKPNTNCTFRKWSDGSTQNPRTDVLSDNLTVTADIRCSSGTQSTSVRTQRSKAAEFNNQDALNQIDARTGTTSTPPTTYQPPETLEESLQEVEQLPKTIDRIVANDPSPETVRSLITLLLSLVEVLGQMMASGEAG